MIHSLDMMQLTPEQLRTFVAAADSGSFTKAASLVHRTQSAVSMQMKRLEGELERSLFIREGRGVTLTVDGETLYRYAKRLLSLHDEALAAVSGPRLDGVVRFGAPEDYAAQYLPQALKRFAAVHPMVTVEVYCDTSPRLRKRFDCGKLDVMLTTEKAGEGSHLHRLDLAWLVADHGGPLDESPLPLALFHEGCLYRHNCLTALENAGISYRVAYSSPSMAGVLAAVRAGLAVAPVKRSSRVPGCRQTTKSEGLPPINPVAIGLHLATERTDETAKSFHSFISNELNLRA